MIGSNTEVGKTVIVFPVNYVGLIFPFVVKKGNTTVEKHITKPEIELMGAKQFFEIKTDAFYAGKIKIIILHKDGTKLWQLNETWKDITKNISRVNDSCNLIIGVTEHLSMFGVT